MTIKNSRKVKTLGSFHYLRKLPFGVIAESCRNIEWLVDSGAFSAHTLGSEIKMADYYAFLDQLLAVAPTTNYFMLDKIGDPEGTRKNYARMLKDGYTPIPVLTPGATDYDLEYFRGHTDYIAIGGLVPTSPQGKARLRQIMEKSPDKTRWHWLGFTEQNYMYHYSPFSVDSSAWTGCTRYGNCSLLINREMKSFRREDVRKRAFVKAAEECGWDPKDLYTMKDWTSDRSSAQRLTTLNYVKWQALMENRKKVGMFLVITTGIQINELIMAQTKLDALGARR